MAHKIDLKDLNQRVTQLQSDFDKSWRDHYQDISTYMFPRKGRFLFTGDDSEHNDGSKRNEDIIDGSGTLALRDLSAGLLSGLTSPTSKWFKLSIDDKTLRDLKPVREWLAEAERRMYTVFDESNFYSECSVIYSELGAFGTGAMLIEEDFETVINCNTLTIGEYLITQNKRRRVDTLYRIYADTVKNVIDQFGIENVSQSVKERNTENNKYDYVVIVHAIEPNHNRDITKIDSINKPFSSVYFEYGKTSVDDTPLSVSGYDEFPYTVPRWDKTSSEVYGRSPGMDALGDISMLHVLQEDRLESVELVNRPPLNVSAEIGKEMPTQVPGGLNITEGMGKAGDYISPTYQIRPDLPAIERCIQEFQQIVDRHLFRNLFSLITSLETRPGVTATEILKKEAEALRLLSPVINNLTPEHTRPAIDRTFNIMMRKGLFPEIPPEMEGKNVKATMISPLALAQRLQTITSIEQMIQFIATVTTLNPDALDKLNHDQVIDLYAEILGVDPSIIVSDQEVAEKREARDLAVQQQQLASNMMDAAQGAKTLSEADTPNNNMLDTVLGGITGGR